MKFRSTRRKAPHVTVTEAMFQGLAPDGGLYVPENFPRFRAEDFVGDEPIKQIASRILAPFFWGDPLEQEVDSIVERAFSFPVPLTFLAENSAVLELFHGPTAAFKDIGARFLAEMMDSARLKGFTQEGRTELILTATSGDTGSAVAAAFERKSAVRVCILFPESGVSERQKKLLTCWGGNVRAFAVKGSFDDCQKMVKAAFGVPALRDRFALTSANSINIARLLPQMVYYAAASLYYLHNRHEKAAFAIPSGNLGNGVAAFWARHMGFPISKIGLATNANRTIVNYFETGRWEPKPSVPTLANAMDVGAASNMERLHDLYPDPRKMRPFAMAQSISDEEIQETIRFSPTRWGEIWCPHTATAVRLREAQATPHWVMVATAHPAKFDSTVEPLAGPVAVPPALEELLARPARCETLPADIGAFVAALMKG